MKDTTNNSIVIGSTTILNKSQTATGIKWIKTTGEKMDVKIHTVAVSAMYHASQHGDTTLLTDVATNMPRSARGKAMVAWMKKHAPVYWDKKSNQIKVKKGWDKSDFDLESAEQEPFFVAKEITETKTRQYDMAALIADLDKIASNKKGKHTEVSEDVAKLATELLKQIDSK
jgi:hypothetical protein